MSPCRSVLLTTAAIAALFAACASTAPDYYVPEFVEPIELAASDVVTRPVAVEHRPPVYPQRWRGEAVQGTVEVRGIVHRDGSFEVVEVVRSDDEAFTRTVLETLADWRYQPATVNGTPVAVYYTITLSFNVSSP
jgi:protein TonB